MLWRGDRRWIYVLCGAEQSGQLIADPGNNPFFFDTFEEGQDPGGGSAPVAGLFLPKRGFGKVWRADQRVRDCLGYATTADETGYSLTVQDFERGVLLTSPDGRSILVVSVVRPCNSCAIIGSYERHRVP